MKKISIAGATGYTGMELLRLLVKHPEVEISALTAESHAGKNIADVAPSLKGWVDQKLIKLSPAVAQECDVLFLALPHTTSMKHVPELLQSDCKIIDLSADYRLHEAEVYGQWYQTPHLNPELLSQAVYGLPELHRKEIKKAQLVANPGCYPTGAILALAPFMQQDWADREIDHHRFQIRRVGSRAQAQPDHAVLRSQRIGCRLRSGGTPPHAGDRAGVERTRRKRPYGFVFAAPDADDARPPHHRLRAIEAGEGP